MVMNGELEVTQAGNRLGFLSDGAFFGEVAILDLKDGYQRTRTVTAVIESHLCFISVVSCLDILCYSASPRLT